jgi:hypothetical protein
VILPDRVGFALNPGYHLVYTIRGGALSQIGVVPFLAPDGRLNSPDDVIRFALNIAKRLSAQGGLEPDAPVAVYSGDTGMRLT